MPKTDTQNQIKPTHSNISTILKQYGLRLRSFTVMPRGIENTTLAVRTNRGTFALRVYKKNSTTGEKIARELDFANFISSQKIPVPKVYKTTAGDNFARCKLGGAVWFAVLMDFAKGKHPTAYSLRALKNVAQVLAKMHKAGAVYAKQNKIAPKYWSHLREKSFSPFIKINSLKNLAVKDFVLRAQACAYKLPGRLPMGYNHMDFDHGNMLVYKDKVSAVLDFADSCSAPTVVCLGYTAWDILYITRDPKKVLYFLKEYSQIRKPTKLEIKTLKNILFFRNFVIGTLEILLYGEKGKKVRVFLQLEKLIAKINFSQ